MATPSTDPSDRTTVSTAGVDVSLGDDWPAQLTDSIVSAVDAVRDKTAVPLDKAAHWIVYGVLAALLGVVAAVLSAIGAVRALDAYLPGEVWGAHAIVGGTFLLAGLFLWSKRRRR